MYITSVRSNAVILEIMTTIKQITIIYNPNSTGDGKKNAEQFQQDIAALSQIPVTLQPTDYAGHAEELVAHIAKKPNAMIVSSSGDGGYHEVVNGILRHKDSGSITSGLLPSGNANDHYHAVHRGNTIKRIIKNDVSTIDVIKVTVGDWSRYAHSYAGIGLTPHIGEKLTQSKLNPFNEVWLTIRYFFSARPVKIRVNNKTKRYDSLVFSNIKRMSKYMTLSEKAKITDGKFEVTGSRAGSASKLIKHLFKASTAGLTDEAIQVSEYSFTSLRPIALQLDGEVFHFKSGATVEISIVPKALRCII